MVYLILFVFVIIIEIFVVSPLQKERAKEEMEEFHRQRKQEEEEKWQKWKWYQSQTEVHIKQIADYLATLPVGSEGKTNNEIRGAILPDMPIDEMWRLLKIMKLRGFVKYTDAHGKTFISALGPYKTIEEIKKEQEKRRREWEEWEKQQQEQEARDEVVVASGMAAVDKMDGHQFEHYCAGLLRKLNFTNVEVTKGSGDQGVDIVAVKEGVRYAIQCKCYSSSLGNSPVQEVNAGKQLYGCHVAVVLTNQHFTSGAKTLAAATGVLLWDRDELERMIKKAGEANG